MSRVDGMRSRNNQPEKLIRAAFLPQAIHKRIKAQAAHEECTVNVLLARIAEEYLNSKQARAARSEA